MRLGGSLDGSPEVVHPLELQHDVAADAINERGQTGLVGARMAPKKIPEDTAKCFFFRSGNKFRRGETGLKLEAHSGQETGDQPILSVCISSGEGAPLIVVEG
jgi:hypothetical protein